MADTVVNETGSRIKRRIVAGTVAGTTSNDELIAAQKRIAELEQALAKRSNGVGKVSCSFRDSTKIYETKDASGKAIKVNGKGNFLVYGIQRMPYSFYASGLVRFIEALPEIFNQLCDHVDDASVKDTMTRDELAKRLEALAPAIDAIAKVAPASK